MALCYFHFFISETVAVIDLQKAHFLKPLFDVACIFNKTALSLLHENDNIKTQKNEKHNILKNKLKKNKH